MKKLLCILLTCASFGLAAPAHATITIKALTQLCGYDAAGKELAPSSHASCQSFIAGIVDYNDLFKSVGKTSPAVDFCLPPALTHTDLQRIVLEYLQKNAAYPESPAAAAVVIALRNEFTCDLSAQDANMVTDPATGQPAGVNPNDPLALPPGTAPAPGVAPGMDTGIPAKPEAATPADMMNQPQ